MYKSGKMERLRTAQIVDLKHDRMKEICTERDLRKRNEQSPRQNSVNWTSVSSCTREYDPSEGQGVRWSSEDCVEDLEYDKVDNRGDFD